MDPPKNDIAIMDLLWYLMNCERSKLMSYCESWIKLLKREL